MKVLLALDVGNTQIFGGVFEQDHIKLRFRKTSQVPYSSDEYGIFLRHVLGENNIDWSSIQHVVMSSVVPELDHSLSSACLKYLNIRPLILQAGLNTGLTIKTLHPQEVGADLIAGAMAAVKAHPKKPLLVVDFGTANTFSVVNENKEFLGALIVPGLRLAMESLQRGTAKLPTVALKTTDKVFGRNTAEAIQTGLYYQAVGLIKEVVSGLKQHEFANQELKVVGTGGLAGLFQQAGVFDEYDPDLVLKGLKIFFELNN